jgi:hypothetical protein
MCRPAQPLHVEKDTSQILTDGDFKCENTGVSVTRNVI